MPVAGDETNARSKAEREDLQVPDPGTGDRGTNLNPNQVEPRGGPGKDATADVHQAARGLPVFPCEADH